MRETRECLWKIVSISFEQQYLIYEFVIKNIKVMPGWCNGLMS